MKVRWHFYRFDHARYVTLRPALRSATTPEAFANLAVDTETEEIVEALLAGEISLAAGREAFVQALCCVGDPLPFDSGLPRFVTALGKRKGGEEATELLAEMLAGGKNLEPWLKPSTGLVGFLTPEETVRLYDSYAILLRRGHIRGGRGKRHGGALRACIGFMRRLFDRDPDSDEMLLPLGELLREAVTRQEGLVAITV